jgi:signal transduction histidine kinase
VPTILQPWLRRLSALRVRLLQSRTLGDVFGALGDELVPQTADGVALVRGIDERPLSRSAVTAGPGSCRNLLPARFWEDPSPARIWLRGHPVALAGDAGWTEVDLDRADEVPTGWCVAVPLSMADGAAGVVLERAPDRAAWTLDELLLVEECVRLAEFSLHSVEQHRRTLEARAIGDAAAHRWAALARLSKRLAEAVDYADVSRAVLNAVVPYLADWALLDAVAPDGRAERVVHYADPAEGGLLGSIARFPLAQIPDIRSAGRAELAGWLLPQVSGSELRQLAGPGEHATLLDLAPRSVAMVPLVAGNQLLGALTLGTSGSGQQYDPGDLALFESLAHQAALALSSARTYHDAQRARMEREEVLAIVSHDLKNPINTVGFALAIFGQEGIPEAKKAPQLGVMERALKQMEELVANLLDAARIDAGRFSVSPMPHDTAALVREALLRAAPLAQRAQVHLEHAGLEDLPPVLADHNRLLQVFANLLENAISFTPPGGRVWVRVTADETALAFEVEDSGPGLEPHELEHVFDRFWQARNSGRAGAGLGLAIARGIVETHRGAIGVRSVPGRGAAFHFTIPRAAGQDAAASPASGHGRLPPREP